MIILAGTDQIDLPEAIEPQNCELVVFTDGDPKTHPRGYWIQICQIGLEEMLKARDTAKSEKPPHGVPFFFTATRTVLLLHPKTKKEFHARFTYCPATKVL